jgi:hypothetical protein
MSARKPFIAATAALLLGGGLTASFVATRARAQAPTAAQASLPAPADPAGAAAAAAEAGEAKDANPTAPTVRLVFRVVPPNIATVTWGNKRLGIIKPKAPLIIERPRDSGPMDVVFKSQGYVTVHTRVYTFTNNTLAVKLTPLDKKNTIYGYREELPPEAAGAGGAGGAMPVPGAPALPGAPPAPAAGTP